MVVEAACAGSGRGTHDHRFRRGGSYKVGAATASCGLEPYWEHITGRHIRGAAAQISVGMVKAVAMRYERMRARVAVVLYHHLWLSPQLLVGVYTAARVKGRQVLSKAGIEHS